MRDSWHLYTEIQKYKEAQRLGYRIDQTFGYQCRLLGLREEAALLAPLLSIELAALEKHVENDEPHPKCSKKQNKRRSGGDSG